MGVHGTGYIGDLPLIIAFVILAAFTYSSGLRAPASIAIVKDILIYITAFAAVIVVPIQLGGFGKIFAAVPPAKLLLAVPGANTTGAYGVYATLALGSALALFLYPHSHDRHLERIERPRHPPQRRAVARLFVHARAAWRWSASSPSPPASARLPEYAAGFKQFGNNFAVPALFLHSFPSWFVGIAFAAIGIGALVPAAIMSIAAANLYTRNIHREFINSNPTDKQEAQMAKWVSLIVKFGALIFIVFVPTQFAIYLQLLGGILIIQTLPSVMLGVYTRWFNDWALLVGWRSAPACRHLDVRRGEDVSELSAGLRRPRLPGLYGALYGGPQSDRRRRADADVQRHGRLAQRRDGSSGLFRLEPRHLRRRQSRAPAFRSTRSYPQAGDRPDRACSGSLPTPRRSCHSKPAARASVPH